MGPTGVKESGVPIRLAIPISFVPRVGLDWWFGGLVVTGWFPVLYKNSGFTSPHRQSKPRNLRVTFNK